MSEIPLIVNGHQFYIDQIPHGQHADMWVWSTDTDESQPFAEAWQAQRDAMQYVRELEREEPAEEGRPYEVQHWKREY